MRPAPSAAQRLDVHRLGARALLLVVLALLAGNAVWWVAPSAAHADAGSTVTSDLHAWQWTPADQSKLGHFYSAARSVTVDQTENLTTQVVHVSWKHFSASSTPYYNASTFYGVRVYECDTATPTSPKDCFGSPTFGESHPGADIGETNVTSAVTGTNGSGGIDFPVLTGDDNSALGCSATHACSIVVEPWAGGDYYGHDAQGDGPGTGDKSHPDCDNHAVDYTLDPNNYNGNYAQVDTGLVTWNDTCNWNAHITVPLHFTASAADCPNRDPDFSSEGSPLLDRAMSQWRPGICRAAAGRPALLAGFTPLSDYQARADFQAGTTDLAFTSTPAADGRAVTYAPVAVSGVAIGYHVDNPQTGRPITDLKLNPRLLAKMLTQSYRGALESSEPCGQYPCAPEVAGNPRSVFDDPEFLALNKHPRADYPDVSPGGSFPTVVFGQNDATYQLTRWIAADPDAASFLAGQPDPYGMKVNIAYLPTRSPSYPIAQFTANDPGTTVVQKACSTQPGPPGQPDVTYDCVTAGMQNTWFPVNGTDAVALALAVGRDTSRVYSPACDPQSHPAVQGKCVSYAASAAQPPGNRSAFAVVTTADVSADRFPTAALETRTGSNAFVSLSTASMSDAVSRLTPNADKVTGTLPFAPDSDAYPLTMVTYGMVAQCGLSPAAANGVSSFLKYAASDAANQYGVDPGNLAPGYLTLTAAQRTQTLAAAAVAAGSSARCAAGQGPNERQGASGGPQPGPGGNPDTPGGNAGGDGGATNGDQPGDSSTSDPSGAPDGDSPNNSAAATPSLGPAAFGSTRSDSTGFSAVALPVVLIAGAALLLLGPSTLFFTRTATGAAWWRRARDLIGL